MHTKDFRSCGSGRLNGKTSNILFANRKQSPVCCHPRKTAFASLLRCLCAALPCRIDEPSGLDLLPLLKNVGNGSAQRGLTCCSILCNVGMGQLGDLDFPIFGVWVRAIFVAAPTAIALYHHSTECVEMELQLGYHRKISGQATLGPFPTSTFAKYPVKPHKGFSLRERDYNLAITAKHFAVSHWV